MEAILGPAPSASGKEAPPVRLTTKARKALEAALNEKITKEEAARCYLRVAGIIFGLEHAKKIRPSLSALVGLPDAELGSKKRKKSKPQAVTAYRTFMSYATMELSKRTDLPVIRAFMEQRSDKGRIKMPAANYLWSMLPTVDKDRLSVWLKPFLDMLNEERLERQQQQGADDQEDPPLLYLCKRYLGYLEQHPEASFIRLLRLDGNTEDLTPPPELAAAAAACVTPRRKKNKSSVGVDAAAAGGSKDLGALEVNSIHAAAAMEMPVDASEEEEAEEGDVGISTSDLVGVADGAAAAVAGASNEEGDGGYGRDDADNAMEEDTADPSSTSKSQSEPGPLSSMEDDGEEAEDVSMDPSVSNSSGSGDDENAEARNSSEGGSSEHEISSSGSGSGSSSEGGSSPEDSSSDSDADSDGDSDGDGDGDSVPKVALVKAPVAVQPPIKAAAKERKA